MRRSQELLLSQRCFPSIYDSIRFLSWLSSTYRKRWNWEDIRNRFHIRGRLMIPKAAHALRGKGGNTNSTRNTGLLWRLKCFYSELICWKTTWRFQFLEQRRDWWSGIWMEPLILLRPCSLNCLLSSQSILLGIFLRIWNHIRRFILCPCRNSCTNWRFLYKFCKVKGSQYIRDHLCFRSWMLDTLINMSLGSTESSYRNFNTSLDLCMFYTLLGMICTLEFSNQDTIRLGKFLHNCLMKHVRNPLDSDTEYRMLVSSGNSRRLHYIFGIHTCHLHTSCLGIMQRIHFHSETWKSGQASNWDMSSSIFHKFRMGHHSPH